MSNLAVTLLQSLHAGPSQGHKGAKGKGAQAAKNQQTNQQLQNLQPRIVMECIVGSQLLWRTDLAEVSDDLKSRYQAAQQAQLTFQLNVPSKGMVRPSLSPAHNCEHSKQ